MLLLFYHIISYLYPLKVYFLLSTERQRVEPDERGLREDMEEVQGRETVTRIYNLRKKIYFL